MAIDTTSLSLALGAVGAVLGVINTLRALSQDRLRLRVTFAQAFPYNLPGMPDEMISVDVLNLSTFPVTITEVGLELDEGDQRAPFISPVLAGKSPIPARLEGREKITSYADRFRLASERKRFGRAYAFTACGQKIYSRKRVGFL